jgi:selenocysteine insertion sequence-binding protein 2
MRRWYTCGLREVRKAVKLKKAHVVILAPNIEQAETEGALGDHVESILRSCGEMGVPVVFALTRKKLGEIYGVRKRMSAIALLEVQGMQEVLGKVLELAEAGRRAYEANRGASPRHALMQGLS